MDGVNKEDLNEILDFLELFVDATMSSYYATDINLQEDAERAEALIRKFRK